MVAHLQSPGLRDRNKGSPPWSKLLIKTNRITKQTLVGNSISIYKLKGDQRADLTSSFGLHMYTTTNVHAFAHTVLPQTYEHPYTRPHILHICTRKKEKDKR